MELDARQQKHIKNIGTQKRIGQENAEIFYQSALQESSKFPFGSPIQKEYNSEESHRKKPPKYPSPPTNKENTELILSEGSLEEGFEENKAEDQIEQHILELEKDNPYLQNKHHLAMEQHQIAYERMEEEKGAKQINGSELVEQNWENVDRMRKDKMSQDYLNQDRTDQDRRNQGKTNQGRINQDRTNQGKANQGRANQGRANQGRVNHERIREGVMNQGRIPHHQMLLPSETIVSSSSTLHRATIEETSPEEALKPDEIKLIESDIRQKVGQTEPTTAPLAMKFLQKLHNFKRDRSASPANQRAQEMMRDILSRHVHESEVDILPSRVEESKSFMTEEDLPNKEILAQRMLAQDIEPVQIEALENSTVLERDGKLKKDFLQDIVQHLVNRSSNEVEGEGEAVIVKDRGLEMGRNTGFIDHKPKISPKFPSTPEIRNPSNEAPSKSIHPESDMSQNNTNLSINELFGKVQPGGDKRNLSFKDLADAKHTSHSFTRDLQKQNKRGENTLKRMVTTMTNKGRQPMPGSFSLGELDKPEISEIKEKLTKEISISFDKEEYEKEKFLKQERIANALLHCTSKGLLHNSFTIWKKAFQDAVNKEAMEREKARLKQEQMQRKLESAKKFRATKELLLKHMVLRRIRRVIRAEQKWMAIVKSELTVYTKKRFFRCWKVFHGMNRIEQKRKQRIKKAAIKAMKDHVERNQLNLKIATVFNDKNDIQRAFSYWNNETRKILQVKENEEKVVNFRKAHLQRNAFAMFKEYLNIMRDINSDEFLRLAEKQDYFEIGITQVQMHKF
ncbi:unnamed protein product [Moneuplotes crassus]|uniref:Uncharacterized protein n=1 Tax=Euplotes crassus TaxID=5936 RepID=A0AAD2DA47_EUPCR|nr:unnamed protein product [Moneuplotes crassus]